MAIPATNLGSSAGTGPRIYITDPGFRRIPSSTKIGSGPGTGGTFRLMGQPIPQGGGRGMAGGVNRKAIARKLIGRSGGVPTRNYPMGQMNPSP